MTTELRKLNRKIDKLQEQLNQQNNFIIDQSLIIHKLIDKLTYKGLGYPFPHKPYDLFDHPWHPDRNTDSGTPYVPNNIICSHCGKDSGIAMNLCMVIPPKGLKCPHCGKIVVQSNTTTISDAPNINTSTTNFDPSIKGYNNRTTTPITFKSYDGTKSTLPVNTLPDRE